MRCFAFIEPKMSALDTMASSGLLPFLESVSKTCHLNELQGTTAAVDAYGWLHQGALSCAHKLAAGALPCAHKLAAGESSDEYVDYCFKYINLLRSYNIKPIMVFEGQLLPTKKDTEKTRGEQRELARTRATELLNTGQADQALEYFRESIDITHELALALIKECRNKRIDCIVAPYKAGAQLAYLNACGIADIIITEDSDLILFGCSKILFKFNLDGCGVLVEKQRLNDAMKMKSDEYSFEKFRHMCMISGCDYLDPLPGISLNDAHKAISLTQNPDIYQLIPRLPEYLNSDKIVVTSEYIENFKLADATIKHQIVFDPLKRKQLPLTDPAIDGTDNDYLKNTGQIDNSDRAFQLALGNIDPIKSNVVDSWNPDTDETITSDSIWSNLFKSQLHQEELKVSTCPPSKRAKIEMNSTLPDKENQINISDPFVKPKKLNKFPSVNMDNKMQSISHSQMTSLAPVRRIRARRASVAIGCGLAQLSNEDLSSDSSSVTATVEPDLMNITKSSDNLSAHNEGNSSKKMPLSDEQQSRI